MDRSKSRTDLLQAGRKKLQQFRQKKDTKGGSSRGKSSKRSDKRHLSELDVDEPSSTSESTLSSQVTEGNVETDTGSNVVSAESLEFESLSNSLALDSIYASVDSSPVVITNSTGDTKLGSDIKLALQDQEVCEIDSDLSSRDQQKGFQDAVAAEVEDVSLRTSDSLGPEGVAISDHVSAPVDILSLPASAETSVAEPVTVEREGDKREESLLLSEDIPNTSLMQKMEDQVTDLGAMQDADGLDMKKYFQITNVEEASYEAEQLGKSVEVFSSTEDVVLNNLSAPNEGQGDGIATSGPIHNLVGETLPGLSYDEIFLQCSQEQISEGALSGQGRGLQEGLNQQCALAGSQNVYSSHESSMGSHEVNLARPLDVSPIFGTSSVNLLQLAEIIRGLNEEECLFLLKSRGAVFDAETLASSLVLPDNDFSEAFQRLKEELFLANLMKNIFSMQLAEQQELQLQSDSPRYQMIAELSQLQASHDEVNEKNQHLIKELANCRVELQDVSKKSVELKNQFDTAMAEVEALSARVVELQISFEMSQHDSLDLSAELADCRALISGLQAEKKGMNENLELVISEKNKLVKELSTMHLRDQAHVAQEQSEGSFQIAITEDSLHMDQQPEEGAPGGPTVNLPENVFDDSLGFVSLMSCLDEMEKVLLKLEKASNEFHSQSASFGRSGEEVSSPGVSKLIRAFESKTHEDEHEVEARYLSNSFTMSTIEETENLRQLLSKWKVHVQSAGALFKEERDGRKIGDAKYSALQDQFEELEQHCSNLEASNVELSVQCEAAKQLLGEIQETKCYVEELFEALKLEDTILKAKNIDLYEKLGHCQSKFSELYAEICDLKRSSNEMSSVIGGQLENLKEELTQRAKVLQQGWNNTTAEIIELVGKLNESVGETSSSTVSSDAHDISHQLAVSVNAAIERIFDFRKKLEATCSEHEIICSSFKEVNQKCDDLLGRNELAVGVLDKMYNDLRKLVLSHSGSMYEDKIDIQSEALPDLFNYSCYETIMKCLGDILNEKLELESITSEMKSELMQRREELDELKVKCLGLDTVNKLIEDVASILDVEQSKIEIDKAPLSCLDSLVSSLVEKTRQAEFQLHMTKVGYGSKETGLDELKEKVHYLETLHFEKENEILVLRESLLQAEEALTASYSELHEKTNELVHSEQRVSSIREKLSIAVAKGKGLVVQRDGLKQSLAETSYELERCLQELQLKDARLHEVETKLKTYAEAGERVEALESELSYIRNSSNALRESFLLKELMLQRIEEVLEDLDFPEQLHSGDIIEKIDWLARSVAGSSLPMIDWEQKDSAGGGSYSDAGYVATDSWKDDSQLPPDSGDGSCKDDSQLTPDSGDGSSKDDSQQQPDLGDVQQEEQQEPSLVPLDGDDLRKKFEELHSKFYGLAEQNEMLEQSLMERNSLVQRWEELVDRIDMPSHLRSMEMEDRIEWLGRALAEAKHHVDSLQLKIEKYDSHCVLLNSDLEESQRAVSALQTELRVLMTEREHLSEKLEALICECEKLSEQAMRAEVENEMLHNEISGLRDVLEEKDTIEEQFFSIDGRLRKLQDLVSDMLPESETKNLASGGANVDPLEELLTKLIENNASLKDIMEHKVAIEEQIFTTEGRIRTLQYLVSDALPESETKSLISGSANIDSLEELLRKLIENHASLKNMSEQKVAIEEQISTMAGRLRKLQDLVSDALPGSDTKNVASGGENIDSLEELLRKLIENNASLKDMSEQKVAIEEQIFTMAGRLRKLQDLVSDALPESETKNVVSGGANIDSLEELLRKLIEKNASLKDISEQKVAIEEQIFTMAGRLRKLQDLVSDALPESEKKNVVSGDANIDSLEELLRKLIENHASLKNILEQKFAIEEQIVAIDGRLRKLQDLVIDELQESETKNIVSGGANIDSLEELLRKLIKDHASLKDMLEKKGAIEEQIFSIDGRLKKLQDLVSGVLPESETRSLVSEGANIDSLEELLSKLIENHSSLKDMLEKKVANEEQIFGVDGRLKKLQDLVSDMLPVSVSGGANFDSLENLLGKLIENHASLKVLLEHKVAIEEHIFSIDGRLRKLRDLVSSALPESETKNLVSGRENIDSLEELLGKLIENHASLQSMKPKDGVELDGEHSQKDDATHVEARSIDMHDKETDINLYKKDLEEALSKLQQVMEERDRTLEKQMSLSSEVVALSKRTEELQVLLNQEEQKSASVREKLNIAVRKGKSLVQHRDSLKQTIEEMGTEMECLKCEINNRESTLAEHAEKLRQMSTYPERLEALESESMYLKSHLAETEHHLQEKEYHLNLILNKLGEIEVGGEGHTSDPVKKLEWVGKLCSDMRGTVQSLEQESRKSKRASELLLAELNEVQERNDAFQEELAKVAAELVDLRKDKDSAEAARLEALSNLEKFSAFHEEGKNSHFSEMMGLKFGMNQLSKGFGEVQLLLANAFLKDLESFQNLEAGLESCVRGNNDVNKHDCILPRSSDNKKSSLSSDSWSDFPTIDHYKDNTIVENFNLLQHQLQEILMEISSVKERIAMHLSLVQEQDQNLSKLIASIEREMTYQRESYETLRKKISEQDGELVALRGNIDYLYEACINSVNVIENGEAELVGNQVEFSDLGIDLKRPSFGDRKSEEHIKTLADRLLMVAKEVTSVRTEVLAAHQDEMKSTITNLQRELQEKDVQRERICSELVKQIKDAEAVANSYSQDLQSLRIQEHNCKKHMEAIETERKILEQRVNELQDRQETAAELEQKIRSQTDSLAAKDQEIEVLMHALDEEEMQMEELTRKIEELEKVVQQKTQEIENLESSRGKVVKKLAVTVSKFDELHHLSASLLSEVEKLQSQLQERDAEISFLRQEVTRCTNDVLVASQISNQSSDEILEFLKWIDTIVSQNGLHDVHPDVKSNSQVHEYKEILHEKLMSVFSELDNLRDIDGSKDAMLQVERSKVEELNRKAETLEASLHEKEMQLNLLDGVDETGKGDSTNSEILEVEPVTNEWTATGTFVTPQVRSLRKGNNDHVAIAVDEDHGSTSRIEDEEDDKVHGFKSLSSSKIVPRFTRPLTDLIDGVWVSCDRTLMRRPILRLGIIIYWAIMHALLAFFVV